MQKPMKDAFTAIWLLIITFFVAYQQSIIWTSKIQTSYQEKYKKFVEDSTKHVNEVTEILRKDITDNFEREFTAYTARIGNEKIAPIRKEFEEIKAEFRKIHQEHYNLKHQSLDEK